MQTTTDSIGYRHANFDMQEKVIDDDRNYGVYDTRRGKTGRRRPGDDAAGEAGKPRGFAEAVPSGRAPHI